MVLHALIFAQIVLESLPISSSTHVAFLQKLWGGGALSEATDHLMHAPTLFVVGVFLMLTYRHLLKRSLRLRISGRDAEKMRVLFRTTYRTLWFLFIATLYTLGIYFVGKPFFSFVRTLPIMSASGLVITAMFFLRVLMYEHRGQVFTSTRSLNGSAVALGVAQGLALLPGVSRLGVTFCTARLFGYNPRRSITLSLLLQLVLMSGAVIRALLDPLVAARLQAFCTWPSILMVSIASLISLCMLFFFSFIARKRATFIFAMYTMTVAVILTLSILLSF